MDHLNSLDVNGGQTYRPDDEQILSVCPHIIDSAITSSNPQVFLFISSRHDGLSSYSRYERKELPEGTEDLPCFYMTVISVLSCVMCVCVKELGITVANCKLTPSEAQTSRRTAYTCSQQTKLHQHARSSAKGVTSWGKEK